MRLENNQQFIGYLLLNIHEDILKMDNEPTDIAKWTIIQRLFLVMMKFYNLGKKEKNI